MNGRNEISVSFGEMVSVFFKRLWLLIFVAVIIGGSTYTALYATYEEQYTSKSTIMVMNPEEGLSASSSAYYYSLTITAVNDCEQLITSRSSLNRVINELGLSDIGITYSRLKNMITISRYPDSHVIEVTVRSGDPELSRDIVNLLCLIGAAQIEEYIDFATAKVIDEGVINFSPSNSVGVEFAIIAGLGAAILLYVIFLLVAVNDDRIKKPEDIEEKLGLSVLSVIPYAGLRKRKKRRHAKRKAKKKIKEEKKKAKEAMIAAKKAAKEAQKEAKNAAKEAKKAEKLAKKAEKGVKETGEAE